ncbi:invasion associated locus B family protein [Paracoccus albus]|uniref:invasion associated locus B family protein n=1 Tax=Paracoccus albus TaxID=3017784 RepID=UPI0022F095BC|nr:invasion associated locus B family protein [Paracoccus albus]WBU61209.1 invasion associated locus B family protein [Paracoccus albus]
MIMNIWAAALAVLMLQGAAHAQTATPSQQPQTEEEATMSDDATSPDIGSEKVQDWIVRCQDAPGGRLCEMTQEHNDRASGRRVLALGIKRLEENSAQLTIVAPLGLKTSEGVTLSGPGDYSLALPFETCLPSGCIVSQQLNAADISTLLEQAELTATMVTTDLTELVINMSTAGMQAAWERSAEIKE